MSEIKKIEITEKGSKEFYQEVINVTAQYGRLIRKPEAKLHNQFREFRNYIVVCVLMLVLFVAETILWGATALNYFLIALFAFLSLMSLFMLYAYNKRLNIMLSDAGKTEIILDDDGIELVKKT